MARRFFSVLWRDRRGVSAIEFSILVPVLILLMFGGLAVMQTVALSRKITITTRALGDLTSQYSTMTASDMSTVINASTQILAPFDATPLGIRITEITTDSLLGLTATVTWSKASGTGVTAYTAGNSFTLPTAMPRSAGQSFIYVQTYYLYTPPFGAKIVGTINLGDSLYMLPRLSTSVSYTGS